MAEVEGFEPSHVGVKVPSLTTWLYLNSKNDFKKELKSCHLVDCKLAYYESCATAALP